MKILTVLLISLLIAGCASTSELKTEYSPRFPPKFMTEPCYPKSNSTNTTIGQLIRELDKTVEQCNIQLKNIRDWEEKERKSTE